MQIKLIQFDWSVKLRNKWDDLAIVAATCLKFTFQAANVGWVEMRNEKQAHSLAIPTIQPLKSWIVHYIQFLLLALSLSHSLIISFSIFNFLFGIWVNELDHTHNSMVHAQILYISCCCCSLVRPVTVIILLRKSFEFQFFFSFFFVTDEQVNHCASTLYKYIIQYCVKRPA